MSPKPLQLCLYKYAVKWNDGNKKFCSIGHLNISLEKMKIISNGGGRGKGIFPLELWC